MRSKGIIAISLVLFLSGCGISQADYDKVVADRDALQQQVNEQSQTMANIENRLSLLEQEVSNSFTKQPDEPGGTDESLSEEISSESETKNAEEVSDSDISIVKEYTKSDEYGTYHYIIIQNRSMQNVDVSSSSMAYDADNNLIGVGEAQAGSVGPSCTTYLQELIETDKVADHYDVTFNVELASCDSVLQDLTAEVTDIGNGAAVKVLNNGTETADFVKACCLFFNNGQLVSHDEAYIGDSSMPGGSSSAHQFTCEEQYDAAEVYLAGYGKLNL